MLKELWHIHFREKKKKKKTFLVHCLLPAIEAKMCHLLTSNLLLSLYNIHLLPSYNDLQSTFLQYMLIFTYLSCGRNPFYMRPQKSRVPKESLSGRTAGDIFLDFALPIQPGDRAALSSLCAIWSGNMSVSVNTSMILHLNTSPQYTLWWGIPFSQVYTA